MSLKDRFNRITGKTRFVVFRLFLHLWGKDIAPLLGILNQTAISALETEGDLETVGEGLVTVCQSLLQLESQWQAVHNEGDVLWKEEDAGDYFEELFTDSSERYLADINLNNEDTENTPPLTFPVTENIVVMLSVACEGEYPELETSLADVDTLKSAFKTLINLHYQKKLRAVAIHFSPAQFGDILDREALTLHFPELMLI